MNRRKKNKKKKKNFKLREYPAGLKIEKIKRIQLDKKAKKSIYEHKIEYYKQSR